MRLPAKFNASQRAIQYNYKHRNQIDQRYYDTQFIFKAIKPPTKNKIGTEFLNYSKDYHQLLTLIYNKKVIHHSFDQLTCKHSVHDIV